jgi:hypothetical protein
MYNWNMARTAGDKTLCTKLTGFPVTNSVSVGARYRREFLRPYVLELELSGELYHHRISIRLIRIDAITFSIRWTLIYR